MRTIGDRHKHILSVKLFETGQLGNIMNYKILGKCDDSGNQESSCSI